MLPSGVLVFTLLPYLVSPAGVKRCAGAVSLQNVFQLQYVPQSTFSSPAPGRVDGCRHYPHGHTAVIAIVIIIISFEISNVIIKCLSFGQFVS